MSLIYHICFATEWQKAKETGAYEAVSLKEEGFIHCSLEHQVSGVLIRYYPGKTGLIKLVIETEKLKSPYIYEWSPSVADTFPHVYGPINIDAVVDVIAIH
jgi:uncharacterized protein (DUF952 family)